MISLLALEVISLVSLIFSVLYVFLTFTSGTNIFLIFAYTVIVSTGVAFLRKKNKLFIAGLLLLALPLVFFQDKSAYWFVLYLIVSIFIYFVKGLEFGNYRYFSDKLKRSFILVSILIFLSVIIPDIRSFFRPGLLFIVIYLLSAIILVRAIRHIESGMDMDKLKKVNQRYISMILVISVTIAIDPIRDFIFRIFSFIYGIVIDGVLAILYIPILLFSILIEKIIEKLTSGEMQELEIGSGQLEYGENASTYTSLIKSETFFKIFISIMGLVLFLVVVYAIYKILSNIGNRDYQGLKYQEEREYIKTGSKKRRFFRERYPKDLKDQIRYYYRRYLSDLNKKEIQVKRSDTSLDIKNASEDIFKNTDKIRDIYIRARYKEIDIKAEDVEVMKRAYKEK